MCWRMEEKTVEIEVCYAGCWRNRDKEEIGDILDRGVKHYA